MVTASACAIESIPPDASQNIRFEPGSSVDFTFKSNELMLSGVFDTPALAPSEALIILVHGYGPTDIRARKNYAQLRQQFNEIGIATAIWDKPGQGKSEGTFDINQSVFSSAREVVDAVSYFKHIKAPGYQKIGIWGVSRAGWIAPIAISQHIGIDFWISVSGTSAQDNFSYLLLSNLPYEGGTPALADTLGEQWREGCKILRTGGSYDDYLQATQELRANDYINDMRGEWPTRGQYNAQQKSCSGGYCANIDNDMCSYVFIDNFAEMLSSLDVDTLAIFGEKDLNIDWRMTKALYEDTIGQNPNASLAIATFERADHNLNISNTGSIKEMKQMTTPQKAKGYYGVQIKWLKAHILNKH